MLEKHLPIEFIKIHHTADGNFPNGVPNPLLKDNRQPTIDAILEHDADLGIAWDGDSEWVSLWKYEDINNGIWTDLSANIPTGPYRFDDFCPH